MGLIIRGSRPASIFHLNGTDENSATYALGWVLEHSPHFLSLMIHAIFDAAIDVSDAQIELQKHGPDGGFTDVEIKAAGSFHCILEAKASWGVPSEAQLMRYRPRLGGAGACRQRLVSISSAEAAMTKRLLPARLDGVEVSHLSWRQVRTLAMRALRVATSVEERIWVRHLIEHLKEFVAVERVTNNTVYVVVLSGKPIKAASPYTWIDVVEGDNRYFHPVGKGWPAQPPNYIGFRYGGRLRAVRHVEQFEVVANLEAMDSRWPQTEGACFVYRLGPAIVPGKEIRTGKIYMNGRVECAIDTLISGSFETIAEARDETKRRLEAVR